MTATTILDCSIPSSPKTTSEWTTLYRNTHEVPTADVGAVHEQIKEYRKLSRADAEFYPRRARVTEVRGMLEQLGDARAKKLGAQAWQVVLLRWLKDQTLFLQQATAV